MFFWAPSCRQRGKMAPTDRPQKEEGTLGFHFSICVGWVSVLHWIFLKQILEAAPLESKLGHGIELHWQITVPSFLEGVRSKSSKEYFYAWVQIQDQQTHPAKLPLGSADSLSMLGHSWDPNSTCPESEKEAHFHFRKRVKGHRRIKLEEKLTLRGYQSFNKNSLGPATLTIM